MTNLKPLSYLLRKFKTMNESIGKWDVVDRLHYGVFETREQMGEAAATHVLNYLKDCLLNQDSVRVVFGCAPSQDEFLASLVEQSKADGFDWQKVEIFHMDEYVGIKADQPQSFRHYLHAHLLNHITPKAFHPLNGDAEDLPAMTVAYQQMLASAPIDLICMGIGENGHVAFNDPPVADFQDPLLVKVIPLDQICRQQQVNDGCFPTLQDFKCPDNHRAEFHSCTCSFLRSAQSTQGGSSASHD